MRICCIGDVVARDGRTVLQKTLSGIRLNYNVDFFIVNAENSAGGAGLTPAIAEEMRSWGVDCITLGDHAWQRKELRPYLDTHSDFCIRPANYPGGAPGKGWTIIKAGTGIQVGVFNLIGRVFMHAQVDCPFRMADTVCEKELASVAIRVCDFHAEATSEKIAMGTYLNGRASIVFGTHTHVQTADERLLSEGTAVITDVGMTGATSGIIGMDADTAMARFLTGLPNSYKAATGEALLSGIVADIDESTGKALTIERISVR